MQTTKQQQVEGGEVIAMPGLRSRMAAYQQNTSNAHKKKHGITSSRDKKKRPGKLLQKLLNPGQFSTSAASNKPQKPVFHVDDSSAQVEGLFPESDPAMDTVEDDPPKSPTRRSKRATAVAAPVTATSPSDTSTTNTSSATVETQQPQLSPTLDAGSSSATPVQPVRRTSDQLSATQLSKIDFEPQLKPPKRLESFDSADDGDD